MKKKGLNFNPDVVIFTIHVGTDILPGSLKYKSLGTERYKPYFEINQGQLVLKGVPVPDQIDDEPIKSPRFKKEWIYNYTKWFLNWKSFSLLKNLLKDDLFYPMLIKLGLAKDISDYNLRLSTLGLIIERVQTGLNNLNPQSKLMVMLIPTSTVENDYLEKALINEFIEDLKIKKIPYINLLPEILKQKDIYFRNDSHFNPKGNTMVAEILDDALKPLIKCE